MPPNPDILFVCLIWSNFSSPIFRQLLETVNKKSYMILCHLTRKFSNEKVSNYHSFSGWSSRELGIAGSSHLRDQKSRTCVLVLGLKMSVLRTINLYFFYPFSRQLLEIVSRQKSSGWVFKNAKKSYTIVCHLTRKFSKEKALRLSSKCCKLFMKDENLV